MMPNIPLRDPVSRSRGRLVVSAVTVALVGMTLAGCSRDGSTNEMRSGSVVEQPVPVTFVGTPGERDCEPLQETQPSSSYVGLAPLRSDTGDDVTISGVVLAAPTCQAVAGATVEFWYAGAEGSYNDDLRRGRMVTDEQGRFSFTVELPGSYTDDKSQLVPSHVHMWISGIGVQARGMSVMTDKPTIETVATVVIPDGV